MHNILYNNEQHTLGQFVWKNTDFPAFGSTFLNKEILDKMDWDHEIR